MKNLKVIITLLILGLVFFSTFGQDLPIENEMKDSEQQEEIQKESKKSEVLVRKRQQRKKKIAEKLELTDAQKEEWKLIEKSHKPEMKELKERLKEDRQATKKEMKELRIKIDAEFTELLNANQKEEWARMKVLMKEKRKNRRA